MRRVDDAIFHLALPEEWAASFGSGSYAMSTRGRTLDQEGFVHCSRRDQVEGVANRFYADLDQLVLLTIDPERIDAPIRDEPPAPGSDERFPHVYGPIPLTAVADATMWFRTGDRWTLDDR